MKYKARTEIKLFLHNGQYFMQLKYIINIKDVQDNYEYERRIQSLPYFDNVLPEDVIAVIKLKWGHDAVFCDVGITSKGDNE